jgi:hypothetical protein
MFEAKDAADHENRKADVGVDSKAELIEKRRH